MARQAVEFHVSQQGSEEAPKVFSETLYDNNVMDAWNRIVQYVHERMNNDPAAVFTAVTKRVWLCSGGPFVTGDEPITRGELGHDLTTVTFKWEAGEIHATRVDHPREVPPRAKTPQWSTQDHSWRL